MAERKNETIRGDIVLDGNVYVDCEFVDSRMIFEGGPPPHFQNCKFTRSHFMFDKAAGNTVNFLRGMLPAQSGMRSVVFGMMPELNQN